MALHLLITGGTGYIGSRLVSTARQRGHRVTLLGRGAGDLVDEPGLRRFEWTLGAPPPGAAFSADAGFGGIDSLIHLAHRWRCEEPEEADENFIGSDALFRGARAQGVGRIVFCSSVSARPGALNRYGRVKWAIEELLEPPAEVAARVGLVYGGPAQSQWGTISALVKAAPILPLPSAGAPVQPIHLDEVCQGLLRLAEAPGLSKPLYGLAGAHPLPFDRFLKLVAGTLYGRRLMVLPIPTWLALRAAELTRFLPFVPTVEREKILGMAGIQAMETAQDLADLGLSLRPPGEALAAEAADGAERAPVP